MIKDLIIRSRSYRRYDENVRISALVLLELIDNARYTPSGHNLQPLRYYVSTTEQMNRRIFSLLKWASYLTDWDGPVVGERPVAYIVILVDKSLNIKLETTWCDIGIVSQTILLGAVERGFGGCLLGDFDRKQMALTLEIIENYIPMLVIAIGKPNEKIILEEVNLGGSVRYYRDRNGNHHVPKRKLRDVILNYNDLIR